MSKPKIVFDKHKDVEELNKKYNVFPELTIFHLGYIYSPREKLWTFTGYRCVKCDRIFKNSSTLPGHADSCPQNRVRQKYKVVEIDPSAKVLTESREVWQPYDFNQK